MYYCTNFHSLVLSLTLILSHSHVHSRRSCSPVLRPSSLCFGQKRKRDQGKLHCMRTLTLYVIAPGILSMSISCMRGPSVCLCI